MDDINTEQAVYNTRGNTRWALRIVSKKAKTERNNNGLAFQRTHRKSSGNIPR